MSSYDLIIKNGLCYIDGEFYKKDLGIIDSKISAIEDEILSDSISQIDAKNQYVLPGIIDSQVHFREPGLTHKEDLETGSLSAALGGVTTFLEMPNTSPATTSLAAIQHKVDLAMEKSCVNFGFFIGGTDNNLDEILKTVKQEGCPGIKIFLGSSTGNLLLYNREKLLEIFKATDAPIAVHSENEEMLNARKSIRDNATSPHEHPVWRNVETALTSTEMIIEIAKEAKRSVHILHITTKDEMEFLAKNKNFCTVEVTPQHLSLSAPSCYDELGTYAQMNPPIRELSHQDGLWAGIANGTVDVIGSDHAPHLREEKEKGYPNSPSGMPGVQTMVPVMLNHVSRGKLKLEKLVTLLCENPAKLYKLKNKGLLKLGFDADITIVDMEKEHTFKDQHMASKCGWTPFKGLKVKGMPTHTIVGGTIVMKNGEIIQRGNILPIRRSY